jgi:hypothetical protein
MYDEECTGDYECEAWTHAAGCLSHTIDPPSEIEVVTRAAQVDEGLRPGRWVRTLRGRVWRADD